jgi:hypothetical protein
MLITGEDLGMADSEWRMWMFAISVSVGAFLLLVLFKVAALDEPLSEAWRFPTAFAAVMLLIKMYFIRHKSN